MKQIALIILLCLTFTKFLYSTDITIEVSNIKNSNGTIYLSLCDEANYKSKTKAIDCSFSIIKKIDGSTSYKFIMPNINAGEYAIMGFVDANNNQKLDTNLIGIPNEPTLLSVKLTSMPSWEKLKIKINGKSKVVNLITQ